MTRWGAHPAFEFCLAQQLAARFTRCVQFVDRLDGDFNLILGGVKLSASTLVRMKRLPACGRGCPRTRSASSCVARALCICPLCVVQAKQRSKLFGGERSEDESSGNSLSAGELLYMHAQHRKKARGSPSPAAAKARTAAALAKGSDGGGGGAGGAAQDESEVRACGLARSLAPAFFLIRWCLQSDSDDEESKREKQAIAESVVLAEDDPTVKKTPLQLVPNFACSSGPL